VPGGIEQFVETEGSTVWASDYDKDYLSPTRLPSTSLCDKLNIKTPEYTITNWCRDGQQVVDNAGHGLGLTVYHTPGHTPDEVAIWDSCERVLFVGDSMYQYAPIFFFETQSVIRYSESVGKMRQLVRRFNAETGKIEHPHTP
jgi:glyoxylase-like metal-dependent hydrolase (beta-lactamase superfamily II)